MCATTTPAAADLVRAAMAASWPFSGNGDLKGEFVDGDAGPGETFVQGLPRASRRRCPGPGASNRIQRWPKQTGAAMPGRGPSPQAPPTWP